MVNVHFDDQIEFAFPGFIIKFELSACILPVDQAEEGTVSVVIDPKIPLKIQLM